MPKTSWARILPNILWLHLSVGHCSLLLPNGMCPPTGYASRMRALLLSTQHVGHQRRATKVKLFRVKIANGNELQLARSSKM